MAHYITLVKFMTEEELVEMVIQIKNFINPTTGKRHHKCKTCEEHWADRWTRAKYLFNMNKLEYLDPLILDDGGYVRYRCRESSEVAKMLKYEFGFEEES